MTIPEQKPIEIALSHIYGIGRSLSRKILASANIAPRLRAKDLQAEEVNRIQGIIDKNFIVEGELRRRVSDNIKHLKEIGTWRGIRHIRGLPIHGRTRVNSRTRRGNVRRTMGSGRIKAVASK